jgi:hypothetical protein
MLKRLLLSGAAMAALTTYAMAQAPAPADPATPPASASPASPATGVDAAAQAEQKADPNLYSNIQGAEVIGQNDESVGTVADLLIDSSGELQSLVIAHGGLVGIGQTYRNYDVSELPPIADGKLTIPELNTASLEGMPEYQYPEAETGRAATDEAPDANAPAPANPSASASGELWPASYLVGAKVGAEEDKATISDLRFEGGRVAAVLIDKGSLGLGNKVQETPFEDLAISGTPAEPQIALNPGGSGASDPMSNPNAESSTVPGASGSGGMGSAPADSTAPAPAPAPAP